MNINCSENERIKELNSFSILDSPDELIFDQITKLATIIFDTPMALISLVAEKRQWFKSKVGILANETSREVSFCAHALHSPNILEVHNALKDVRFKSNPLVTSEPNIRFYAGAPLITKNNIILGTLCIIDTKPRKLTETQKVILNILGAITIKQMEDRLVEIEVSQRRIQLSESLKLSALGEMAGNIAHEINNPLAVIQMHAVNIEKFLQNKEPNISKIIISSQKIYKMVQKISKIIKGVSLLSRNGDQELFEVANIRQIIEDTFEICSQRIDDNRINLILPNPIPTIDIRCRQIQICQVLLNLINNSIDAIENIDEKWIRVEILEKSNFVEIQISDSGEGVSKELQTKIFERFFTTKKISRGIGLGLNVSRSIAASHGGTLTVDPLRHSCFVLRLPINKGSSR